MLEYVEIALSTVAILVFAVERFRTPPSDPKGGIATYRISRSTTTAASYYTAVSLYGAIALGVFAFLLLSPQALDKVLALDSGMAGNVPGWARKSPPLLVALILTVLLPKIPFLSSIDEWFRTRLQRMAAIPHEVRRLSAELRRAPFRLEAEDRQELVRAMVDKGFDPADVRFEEASAPHYLWTKLSMLMHELDGWEADARFTTYVLTYPNEFNALKLRYEALLPRARRCFSLLRDLATDPESAKKGGAVYAYRDDFVQEADSLLKDVYEAISNAVLLCELTQRARVSQFIKLGFGLDPDPPRRLTLNELLGLFTGLSVIYALAFVLMGQQGKPLNPRVLLTAIMIAAIYCVAVWCAIYPKARWSVARLQPGKGRPWGWYLLSGVTAAAAGALISYTVKLAGAHGDYLKAWDLYWQTSPWAIMTFATAYAVAFLADDEPREGFMGLFTADRLRWVEAIALTAALAVTAWLVHSVLASTHAEAVRIFGDADRRVQPLRPLFQIEILTVIIGFAIGSLVPSWYRTTPLEPQPAARVPVVAATVSVGGK